MKNITKTFALVVSLLVSSIAVAQVSLQQLVDNNETLTAGFINFSDWSFFTNQEEFDLTSVTVTPVVVAEDNSGILFDFIFPEVNLGSTFEISYIASTTDLLNLAIAQNRVELTDGALAQNDFISAEFFDTNIGEPDDSFGSIVLNSELELGGFLLDRFTPIVGVINRVSISADSELNQLEQRFRYIRDLPVSTPFSLSYLLPLFMLGFLIKRWQK